MITTVTLNASVDKAYILERPIELGSTQRVSRVINSAGGKGINVARIINLLGGEAKTTGFVGGFNGEYLVSLLEKDKIANEFVNVHGETRTCINILDGEHGSTELLESGFTITEYEENLFLAKFNRIIDDSYIICAGGSLPKGVSEDIYAKLITIAREKSKKLILDTSGDALAKAISAKPFLIKPNSEELEQFFGKKFSTIEEKKQAGLQLLKMGAENVIISLGKDGALLLNEFGIYRGKTPDIKVINTVGSGDALVGGFAFAIDKGFDFLEAFRIAIAAGTANTLNENTGFFSIEDYGDIYQQVELERLA